MEWREDLSRITNKSSEPSKSEVLGKLLMDLAIGSEAVPSARNQKMNELVEHKSSKGKGSLETGSGSGSGSGMGRSKGSTARKQQAESVPNKNKISQKVLLEQLIMGSGSVSGLGSGSVSGPGSGLGRSARQQRMKQRVAEGSSKGRNQIQNKRFEYTAQDKNIICGLTFLTVYALFRDMMKK